jgi:hypothetical protein
MNETDLRDSDIQHPDLRRLFGYWRDRAGDNPLPARADLDPVDFFYLITRVALVEIIETVPATFRWRVCGSWYREEFGIEGTGMMVEDWPFIDQREAWLTAYRNVRIERRPRSDFTTIGGMIGFFDSNSCFCRFPKISGGFP